MVHLAEVFLVKVFGFICVRRKDIINRYVLDQTKTICQLGLVHVQVKIGWGIFAWVVKVVPFM